MNWWCRARLLLQFNFNPSTLCHRSQIHTITPLRTKFSENSLGSSYGGHGWERRQYDEYERYRTSGTGRHQLPSSFVSDHSIFSFGNVTINEVLLMNYVFKFVAALICIANLFLGRRAFCCITSTFAGVFRF